jgi:hypothetical protein
MKEKKKNKKKKRRASKQKERTVGRDGEKAETVTMRS